MPQSDGDIARWFEQAASKNKAPHNAVSLPCKVKAQTVYKKTGKIDSRAPLGAREFIFSKKQEVSKDGRRLRRPKLFPFSAERYVTKRLHRCKAQRSPSFCPAVGYKILAASPTEKSKEVAQT